MSSTSTNTSNSTSTTEPVETTENGLIDALSATAAGMAQQMNQWAQGEFAKTSAITDEAVGNFFQAAQQMTGLSSEMIGQYNNLFAPENAALVQDANDYASTDRQQVDMGQAGATQAQAGDAALKNSESNLVSMGIDPSSGRYAALDKAAAVQNAANIAGAENTQRNSDIQTGQALRNEAVQVGAQLPSAISNAENTAIQANTGASNAELANANTGVNLNQLANQYLQTAMGIKLPLSQTKSQSNSNGNSMSTQPSKGSSGGGGSGGGGSPGGGGSGAGGPAWMPQHGASGQGGIFNAGQGGGSKTVNGGNGMGNDWGGAVNDYENNLWGPNGSLSNTDTDQWTNPAGNDDSMFTGGSGSMGIGDPSQNGSWDTSGAGGQNPFDDSGFGQTLPSDQFGGSDNTFTGSGGASDTEFGNINYDPSANSMDNWDQSDLQGGAWNDPTPSNPNTDWGNGADQYSGSSGGGDQDWDNMSDDQVDSGFDDSDYAAGGPVRSQRRAFSPHTPIIPKRVAPRLPFAGGGRVAPAMSPSGGARTDDVRANLNAGEFVIPKDVAAWKGQEFFHNLMAQSRDKRMKMQAALGTGGKMRPTPNG